MEIKLSKLYLNGKFSENDNYLLSNIDNDYPFSVHIVIDEFKNHFGNLGQIELETEYLSKSKYWKINRLSIFFDETRIDSSGFWENKHQKKISNANGVAKKNLD